MLVASYFSIEVGLIPAVAFIIIFAWSFLPVFCSLLNRSVMIVFCSEIAFSHILFLRIPPKEFVSSCDEHYRSSSRIRLWF